MNRNWVFGVARSLLAAASFITLGSAHANAQTEIVLHTGQATAVSGDWQLVGDGSAASGVRMWNPDRGRAKLTTPSASPADYFELTFNAEAYRPYRLWMRGKADNNAWTNDSVFVQFSSSLDYYGAAINRIGTAEAMTVSLEACSGCGVSGWGWEDNGYGGAGLYIHFQTAGPQTIRVQRREDGISIDQIVLSPYNYYTSSPGSTTNDGTILPSTGSQSYAPPPAPEPVPAPVPAPSGDASEIVLHTRDASRIAGDWQAVSDGSAADAVRLWSPDRGRAKVASASASPGDYFELTFTAEAGRPYHLWIRGKADYNSWANDSVYLQFSHSLDAYGSAVYRIGTASGMMVSVERCSGCGLSEWGWEDNGWGGLGSDIYFAASGPQTLRVQRREDGISIDQIVLSSSAYRSSAPGGGGDDWTILPATQGTTTVYEPAPAPTPEPAPAPAPAPAPSPAPSGGLRVRLLQWNLHHSVGTDGVYDLGRIINAIAAMNPDIITLNEVERYTSWGAEDQPEIIRTQLQQLTGRTWYSHFIQEFGNWSSSGKGHQILSVYPFDSIGYTTTTPSSGLKWAGAIGQATFTLNYRTVNLFVAHLDPYDQGMRLIQARDVLGWASGFGENRILTGDMNAWPDQSSILEINNTYHDSWTVALNQGTASASGSITPYGATKNGRIDYIFYSKYASNLVVIDSRVYDLRDSSGHAPSDHRPVLTTFEVR